ncbi:hypothetical protein Dsin_029989 [Dipteronia sinensis]|uniref:CCHC-type domain-containing protein n=1 Tax=Dipteronia sinensis TaxID=43782 RepID=A0AAE0DQL3_9ROSI|nr:hypothetical protein Dsin_029989 [Dipteronia sinensis]
MDIAKPLRRCLRVNVMGDGEETLMVLLYERLLDLCFWCGRLGHSVRDCIEALVIGVMPGEEEGKSGLNGIFGYKKGSNEVIKRSEVGRDVGNGVNKKVMREKAMEACSKVGVCAARADGCIGAEGSLNEVLGKHAADSRDKTGDCRKKGNVVVDDRYVIIQFSSNGLEEHESTIIKPTCPVYGRVHVVSGFGDQQSELKNNAVEST